MRTIARLICLFGILSLAACGGAEDDHVHEDGAAAHAHDGGEAHAPHGEELHEHTDGDHAESAPVTEAFYGDDAGTADATPEPGVVHDADEETAEAHSHGDGEPHTHDH